MYAYDYFIYSVGYRLGRNSEIQNFGGDAPRPRPMQFKVADPVFKIRRHTTTPPMKAIEQRSDEKETRVILLAYPR